MKSQKIRTSNVKFASFNWTNELISIKNSVAFANCIHSYFNNIHHSDAKHMIVIVWFARHVAWTFHDFRASSCKVKKKSFLMNAAQIVFSHSNNIIFLGSTWQNYKRKKNFISKNSKQPFHASQIFFSRTNICTRIRNSKLQIGTHSDSIQSGAIESESGLQGSLTDAQCSIILSENILK